MINIEDLDLTFASVRAALAEGADPVAIVAESCRRVATWGAGDFTSLVPLELAVEQARAATTRARSGVNLPLIGLTFCVKDNINVAGMKTTANCPGLSIEPSENAAVVQMLEAAGAVLVGKNTMDQFATGLSGTRSDEPLCRNAIDSDYIPGGSSSGSAVAVAKGLVAFSLGSDTGGSGRVPAACNGIVGLKPSIGLVSTRGLLFNNRAFDCIPIFARNCSDATDVLRVIEGFDPEDPTGHRGLSSEKSAVEASSRQLAVVRAEQLDFEGDRAARTQYFANLEILKELGFALLEIDFTPFSEAGRLVFESAFVAERLVEYSDVMVNRPETIHPVVKSAVEPGLSFSAKDAFEALIQMSEFRCFARKSLSPFLAFVVPTIPTIFTIAEMLAEPQARNTIMGRYTYFVNPMDLCAVAVPGLPLADGLPSSLSFIGLSGQDGPVGTLAARFEAAAVALSVTRRM